MWRAAGAARDRAAAEEPTAPPGVAALLTSSPPFPIYAPPPWRLSREDAGLLAGPLHDAPLLPPAGAAALGALHEALAWGHPRHSTVDGPPPVAAAEAGWWAHCAGGEEGGAGWLGGGRTSRSGAEPPGTPHGAPSCSEALLDAPTAAALCASAWHAALHPAAATRSETGVSGGGPPAVALAPLAVRLLRDVVRAAPLWGGVVAVPLAVALATGGEGGPPAVAGLAAAAAAAASLQSPALASAVEAALRGAPGAAASAVDAAGGWLLPGEGVDAALVAPWGTPLDAVTCAVAAATSPAMAAAFGRAAGLQLEEAGMVLAGAAAAAAEGSLGGTLAADAVADTGATSAALAEGRARAGWTTAPPIAAGGSDVRVVDGADSASTDAAAAAAATVVAALRARYAPGPPGAALAWLDAPPPSPTAPSAAGSAVAGRTSWRACLGQGTPSIVGGGVGAAVGSGEGAAEVGPPPAGEPRLQRGPSTPPLAQPQTRRPGLPTTALELLLAVETAV